MRDVLFESLAYRSPHRHDQSLMDGAGNVRNLFYVLTPAEPDLGDGYWDSLTGACRELRSYDLPSILSRPLPHDKTGVAAKQTPSSSSNSLKMSDSFFDFRPFEHGFSAPNANLSVIPCSSNAAVPLLCWHLEHPFHGSFKPSHFFPSSAARAVCALRSLT